MAVSKSLTKLTPSIQYMIKLYFDAKTYSFYQQIRKEKSIRGNQAVKRIHDPQLKKVIYLVIIMLMPKLFLQKPSKKLNAKNTNLLWNTIYNNATIKENYSERKTIRGHAKNPFKSSSIA